MYGLTAQGFVPKTLAIIQAEIDADLRVIFGPQINTAPQSVFGQLKGLYSEREALLWELLADLYSAQYPATATDGIDLDLSVSITGHRRLEARASRIEGVVLTGTPGTIIPAGTVFSVAGDPAARFSLQAEVLIGAGGSVGADVVALEAGPITVDAGTLTRIDTPVSGLDSVTNPASAITGRNRETGAELRMRRNDNLQFTRSGPVEAIRSAILALNEDTEKVAIEHVRVFENFELETDARGLPGKSFEVVVYQAGGSTERDQEIANTIFLTAKPAGIQVYGAVTVPVIDSEGFVHACKITRPTQVPIYLELDLSVTAEYPDNGDAAIAANITAWGNRLGPGADIVVYPALISQLAGIAGITNVAVRIGRTAAPTGDANVTIDDGSLGEVEMSEWDVINIVVAHI